MTFWKVIMEVCCPSCLIYLFILLREKQEHPTQVATGYYTLILYPTTQQFLQVIPPYLFFGSSFYQKKRHNAIYLLLMLIIEIRFATPIFHCNINNDGKICHEIITTRYAPTTSVETILTFILELLKEPNHLVCILLNGDNAQSGANNHSYKDALDIGKGTLLREDPHGYNLKVAEEATNTSLESIYQQFQLEQPDNAFAHSRNSVDVISRFNSTH